MDHFSSNGVDIAYTEVGEGPPILLIHGFGSNHAVNWQSTSWFDTLTKARRHIIAMDVRGHGASEKLYRSEDYRPTLMATDAANLLDHLGIKSADVMGYSMGGRIAAVLAIEHPEKVKTLIIGGMGMGIVEGIGGEEEIVAALEAPTVEQAAGQTGIAYRKFAEQTSSDRRALAACIVGQRLFRPTNCGRSVPQPLLLWGPKTKLPAPPIASRHLSPVPKSLRFRTAITCSRRVTEPTKRAYWPSLPTTPPCSKPLAT